MGEPLSRLTIPALLDQLFYALAGARAWSSRRTMQEAVSYVANSTGYSESTVYRWRQGRLLPNADTFMKLLRIGKEEAGLEREWAEDLLTLARHPGAIQAVDQIWGPRVLVTVPNNLPAPTHSAFVGRASELAHLFSLMSPTSSVHPISVGGSAGVGKTAIVLEAAHRSLRASTGEAPARGVPAFGAIVFASAKREILTPYGTLEKNQAHVALNAVCEEIVRVLDARSLMSCKPGQIPSLARDLLARQRSLLIVDNLETLTERQELLGFLFSLPHHVKAIVTTREEMLYSPVKLGAMPEDECLELIRLEAAYRNLALEEGDARLLAKATGGLPIATIYSVGQLAAGFELDQVLDRLTDRQGDIARFCFNGSVIPLRGRPAHRLLMALSMFPRSADRSAVIQVAGLNNQGRGAEEGLVRLIQLSLISPSAGRLAMHSLTREYAFAELASCQEFEREARERWVKWYQGLAEVYGVKDWGDFHVYYDRIDDEWENLLEVFQWCAERGRYEVLREFWLTHNIEHFASLYGYWQERLQWLEWLREAGLREGDWRTVVLVMRYRAWPLLWMAGEGQLEEADALLSRAWELREHLEADEEAALADDLAVLSIRRKDWPRAREWIDVEIGLVGKMDPTSRTRLRLEALVQFNEAEIAMGRGRPSDAKAGFAEMHRIAEEIGWQRMGVFAQRGMARVLLLEGDYESSLRLLEEGLEVSEKNKDRRCAASCMQSIACLHAQRGVETQAVVWAIRARDLFLRLGMEPEVEEMTRIIEGPSTGRGV